MATALGGRVTPWRTVVAAGPAAAGWLCVGRLPAASDTGIWKSAGWPTWMGAAERMWAALWAPEWGQHGAQAQRARQVLVGEDGVGDELSASVGGRGCQDLPAHVGWQG